MKSDFVRQIESFVIGDCEEIDNFAVFPVYADGKSEDFITLEEGLKKGLTKITELTDSGSVPTLRVKNFSKKYVVIFVGEILIGAKQNRVVNTTIVIKPLDEIEIPVSCIEEGRWSYQKEDFSDFDSYAYTDLRKEIVRDVNMNLKTSGLFNAQQGKVWDMVNDKLSNLKVSSKTYSLDEAYNANRFSSENFVKKFKTHKNQIGIFILVNNKFQVMEICSRPEAFKKMYPKIIRSVFIDEIKKSGKISSKKTDPNKELSKIIKSLKKSEVSVFKSVGEGRDLRIEGEGILGSAVEFNSRLLHLTVFPSVQNISERRKRWNY